MIDWLIDWLIAVVSLYDSFDSTFLCLAACCFSLYRTRTRTCSTNLYSILLHTRCDAMPQPSKSNHNNHKNTTNTQHQPNKSQRDAPKQRYRSWRAWKNPNASNKIKNPCTNASRIPSKVTSAKRPGMRIILANIRNWIWGLGSGVWGFIS